MKTAQRLPMVDTWRGAAVLGMIIYHVAFALADVYGYRGFYDHVLMQTLGHVVRTSFLFLVGVSMSLSSSKNQAAIFYQKQRKRAVIVFLAALLITLGSYFYEPSRLVYFGILHSIAFGILFLHPLVKHPKASFLFGLIILLGTYLLSLMNLSDPSWSILYRSSSMSIRPLDHFAIFPAWSAITFGLSFGYLITVHQQLGMFFARNLPGTRFVNACGKKALLIYLVHIPLVYVLAWGLQSLPFS